MPDVKVGWRSGTVPSLLDTYTGAVVAYSLRKLRNAHSGFAIRVRRSSDNTEQNIGFTATGGLDTTALLSFVGAGNGFVTTWYDQSGNSRNAYQTTASYQPFIVNAGEVVTNGGKPAIRNTANGGFLIDNVSIGATNSMYALIDFGASAREYFGTFGNSWAFYQPNGEYKANNAAAGSTNAAFSLDRFIGSLQRYGGKMQYYSNSNPLGSEITLAGSATAPFILGNLIGEGYGYGFIGDQQEVIVYDKDMRTSRASMESDINSYYSIWDNDVEAFITATNLPNHRNSIRTLVATLKSANIWSKLKAVYPFVGGTANTHKFNLKDPRDLDAAYRLNFYGGWTHYVSGPYGNGFNTYADTNLNPSVALSPNSSSIGIWTPNGMANHGFGVWSNSGANRFAITEYGGGYVDSQMTSPSTRAYGITYTTAGFIMGSRTSATSNKIYRFGSLIPVHPSYGGVPHNTTTNTADYPNANFWLGRVNGNTSINYYNNSLYFAYIADGLTDAEILALSNAALVFRQSIGYY